MKQLLARGYARAFARPSMQGFNHALYHLALRGMGYNNGWQLDKSGEAHFVKNVLAPSLPKFCLDIGANRGEYSRLLLQETGALVTAFEPLPGVQEALCQVKAQYPDRFVHIDEALGDSIGLSWLHHSSPDSELASLSSEIGWIGAENTHATRVKVTTLDDYFPAGGQRVDFVKIDVEGYEYEVLRGAGDFLAANKPNWIQIEMNVHQMFRGHTLNSIKSLLPSFYTETWQLLPRGMRKVDVGTPDANTFCYSNFVFRRTR